MARCININYSTILPEIKRKDITDLINNVREYGGKSIKKNTIKVEKIYKDGILIGRSFEHLGDKYHLSYADKFGYKLFKNYEYVKTFKGITQFNDFVKGFG